MISKTQISKRLKKKTNPEIVETIELAKKKNLLELAKRLSGPKSNYTIINLDELNKLNELNKLKENKIMIVGKVLGSGNIEKKISISALGFSNQAREKLKKAGCTIKTLKQEIEANKELKGVEIKWVKG